MTELYLIAHKVRGEPAFDIAQKLQIGDEEGWIIPTSGHRAYPYHTAKLSEETLAFLDIMPSDWPDHYPTSSAPKTPPHDLLKSLGLLKPIDENIRRV